MLGARLMLHPQGLLSLAARSAGVALAVLGSGSCGPTRVVAPSASSAAMWFHPLARGPAPPSVRAVVDSLGSTDWLSLFAADAPWPRAMARTQIVGLYAGWVASASNQDFRQVVAFLNAHDMGIELEAPSLQATATCGSGVEGYLDYPGSLHDFTVMYLLRLKAAGARVLFVKPDEPYYFGSLAPDPRSCHSTVSQIAAQVGEFAQLVDSIYPRAAVGDIEPIIASGYTPDAVTALGQWHDTYRSVTGRAFPFFIADVDFSNPAWPSIVKELEAGSRQRGMRFGMLYIGDFGDSTDQEWTSKAVARFHTYEGANAGRPDYALFQSWEPHPLFCLPESDPTTFTGVLDAYLDAAR